MNNLNRHMRSDAVKWVIVGIVLIAIIATIVLGCFSSWFTNWDVETWFGQTKDGTEQTEPEKESDLIVKPVAIESEIAFAFLDDVTEGDPDAAVSVVEPVSGMDYVWRLWSDYDDGHYGPKVSSDFVLLTTSDTGTPTAYLTLKEQFDHVIILSCTMYKETDTSHLYSLGSGTCTIDCKKKLSGITILGTEVLIDEALDIKAVSGYDTFAEEVAADRSFDILPTKTIGTVDRTFSWNGYEIYDVVNNQVLYSRTLGEPYKTTLFYIVGVIVLGDNFTTEALETYRADPESLYKQLVFHNRYELRVKIQCGGTFDLDREEKTLVYSFQFPSDWITTYSVDLSEDNVIL